MICLFIRLSELLTNSIRIVRSTKSSSGRICLTLLHFVNFLEVLKNVRKLDKIFTINVMFFICDNSVLKYVKLSSIFEGKSEQSELTKKEIFLKW